MTRGDISDAAQVLGVPKVIVGQELAELADSFLPALWESCDQLVTGGFLKAERFAEHIENDFIRRSAAVL